MGNVTLPTPVALAGGAICILGGYLLGALAGPDAPSRTTAVVGDQFRFVAVAVDRPPSSQRSGARSSTMIYGDVVP